MKLKNILYTSSLAAVMLMAGGCAKDKFDINSNPDEITDVSVSPTVLLPAALQTTSKIVAADWSWLNMWMGYWARSGSYQSITDVETYQFNNDFPAAGGNLREGNPWADLYANAANYQSMIAKAQASGAGFYEAIGRIMKAHNFQILVDIYGNVPYSEAFQGTGKATPKYDNAIDIYRDLFNQLDAAITLLHNDDAISEARNPEITTSDLVYAGHAEEWIRFANTLRLRMLVHLHNGVTANNVVTGIDIPAQVAKITSEGFLGTGESAHLNPGFSATKPNPFYRAFVEDEAGTTRGEIYRANDYAIRYYTYNGDLRINRFYVAPASGHQGNRFGRPSDNTGLYIGSRLSTVIGPGLLPQGAASRAWILTSVESLFLQAEARHRGILNTGPAARTLLQNAVRESFVWLGLTTAQADTYMSNNAGYEDVDYDAPGGGLYTILSQKWFALNSIATYEIWTDHRRTDIVYGASPGVGFDPGPPISIDPGNTATSIPRRLFYPQSEYNYNAASVGAQGAINVFNSKIFWDLN